MAYALPRPQPSASVPMLAAAMVYPTLLTLVYFVLMVGHPLVPSIYGIGKLVQFLAPVLYVILMLRQRPPWVPRSPRGLIAGIAFGALVLAAGLAAYGLVLRDLPFFETIAVQGRERIESLGVDSRAGYWLLALGYCLVHSGLEEYYWRWFVFRHLHARMAPLPAVVTSAAAFTAHHVIVLYALLGGHLPLTAAFSACVFVGGVTWAWLYLRYGNLMGAWVSHAMIDALIFIIGYDVIFAAPAG